MKALLLASEEGFLYFLNLKKKKTGTFNMLSSTALALCFVSTVLCVLIHNLIVAFMLLTLSIVRQPGSRNISAEV